MFHRQFARKRRESAVSIGYGIDDEATCIDKKSGDFLIECKHREQRTCEAE